MLPMLPVIVPEVPCVDQGPDDGGGDDVDGEFAPEICGVEVALVALCLG